MTNPSLDRRRFLLTGSAVTASAALAGPFGALGASPAGATPAVGSGPDRTGGYGELRPVRDQTTGLELLKLPRGFEYLTFGWTGDHMADGTPTPSSHDGMAAFRDGDLVRLVRNHERRTGTPFAGSSATYDPAASGGTTTLVFDPDAGTLVEDYASLSGTIRNCAGGPTPEGTWLTCEETTDIIGDVRHGYVFEVPADGLGNPNPIRGMGRFSHEATATDPATGVVYETEDTGTSRFYRYVPNDRTDLHAGGRLEAMVLEGTLDTVDWTAGRSAAATWVTVDNPDWGPGELSCAAQAQLKGAARIVRGEGLWYGNDVIYVVSTSGGPAGQGQVFAYDPAASTFTCVFASRNAAELNAPDNVCVSPRGGIVLCEDGSDREYLHGLTPRGDIFPFAENNVVLSEEVRADKGYSGLDYTGSEWCGATFEPKNGSWLFVNIQSPGFTAAITGPWRNGAL
ncbi:MAG TPA: alkaline phosphatase PhoX [Acidimicrobiales bacterium]|nr:alkaline phosphatase PhoX [Acidimicrobiales bacterium]